MENWLLMLRKGDWVAVGQWWGGNFSLNIWAIESSRLPIGKPHSCLLCLLLFFLIMRVWYPSDSRCTGKNLTRYHLWKPWCTVACAYICHAVTRNLCFLSGVRSLDRSIWQWERTWLCGHVIHCRSQLHEYSVYLLPLRTSQRSWICVTHYEILLFLK